MRIALLALLIATQVGCSIEASIEKLNTKVAEVIQITNQASEENSGLLASVNVTKASGYTIESSISPQQTIVIDSGYTIKSGVQ